MSDWRYGHLVKAAVTPELFADLGHAVVDTTVLVPFDGRADDIVTYVIVATRAEADAARADLPRLAERAKAALHAGGFPAAALASFELDATSQEEIDQRGGSFYYFH